jgi:hypothetical protein
MIRPQCNHCDGLGSFGWTDPRSGEQLHARYCQACLGTGVAQVCGYCLDGRPTATHDGMPACERCQAAFRESGERVEGVSESEMAAVLDELGPLPAGWR